MLQSNRQSVDLDESYVQPARKYDYLYGTVCVIIITLIFGSFSLCQLI